MGKSRGRGGKRPGGSGKGRGRPVPGAADEDDSGDEIEQQPAKKGMALISRALALVAICAGFYI